jgi:hypothetical protein
MKKTKVIKPLGLRLQKHIEDSNIDLNVISELQTHSVPFWELSQPTVNLELSQDKKSDTTSLEFIQKFRELKEDFSTHNEIYTDGSKDKIKVASAAIQGNANFSACLPNNSSIFTAEAKALQLAFDFIKYSDN